jgi:hypothetical protein
MKNFPIPIQKILPAIILVVGSAAIFSHFHSSIAPVEASTTRNPVVAPAGTVLRVRMNQALDAGHSRPGDRFEGVLDAPVTVGTVEILPKGTPVTGHVLSAGRSANGLKLALILDSCDLPGRQIALLTSAVVRSGNARAGNKDEEQRVSVAAESIMGFTLTGTFTA